MLAFPKLGWHIIGKVRVSLQPLMHQIAFRVHLLSGDPNGSFFCKQSVVAASLGDGDIFRIIFAKDAFVDIEITWG
jgi:hypothetical protein